MSPEQADKLLDGLLWCLPAIVLIVAVKIGFGLLLPKQEIENDR